MVGYDYVFSDLVIPDYFLKRFRFVRRLASKRNYKKIIEWFYLQDMMVTYL